MESVLIVLLVSRIWAMRTHSIRVFSKDAWRDQVYLVLIHSQSFILCFTGVIRLQGVSSVKRINKPASKLRDGDEYSSDSE